MRLITRSAVGLIALSLVGPTLAGETRGVLYNFSASWCGPCQQVAPIVSKLARQGLPIRKVDFDREKKLAEHFRIETIPTFVLVIDGREVDRVSGVVSESTLRRMMARIPTTHIPSDNLAREAIDVELGQPAPIPRPAPIAAQVEPQVVAQAEEEPTGLRRLWPFGRKEEEAAPTVRGNDSSVEGLDATPATTPVGNTLASGGQPDPMQASVRIRVVIDGNINLGSGTVISSQEGRTLILTCGHIFRGFKEGSKIEVDVLPNGESQQYGARLEKFDLDADVGLLSIPTDVPVPSVRFAVSEAAPAVGEHVASIGCSGGAAPTREQLRITAVDKYRGPNNIECTGVPVRGRSGGGLFNRRGEVVGVCIAADPEGQRGLYSGLFAVHQMLRECGLASLFESQQPATTAPLAAAAPQAMETQPAAQPAAQPAPMERTVPSQPVQQHPVSVAATPAAVAPPVETQPSMSVGAAPAPAAATREIPVGSAEVVVMIRDTSRPNAPQKVVIIHRASPKFMAYLHGELEAEKLSGVAQRPVSNVQQPANNFAPAVRREPSAPSIHTSASRRIEAAQPAVPRGFPMEAVNKGSLEPTSLSHPAQPRRFVRSADAR